MAENTRVKGANGWTKFVFAPKAGRVVDSLSKAKALTVEGALKRGGLDWETGLVPLYAETPAGMAIVPRQFATVRSDTNEAIAPVGTSYAPMHNAQAFRFVDDVLAQAEASIIGAGATRGGARVYGIVRIGDDIHIGGAAGELVHRLLILSTSHDGTKPLRVTFVPLRDACWNGLVWYVQGAAREYTLKHTLNNRLHVDEARQVLNVAFTYFAEFETDAAAMLKAKMTKADVREFLAALVPVPDDEGKKRTIAENTQDAILSTLASASDLDGIRNTRWGMLNAVAAWQDHEARTRVIAGQDEHDLRFERAIALNDWKQRAHTLLRVAA
jgi:phage/plasmid-like protein (TIGR03299 family)